MYIYNNEMENTEKEMPLGWLNYGCQFVIPGLHNLYRNLRLVRNTDCSAVVSGDRKLKINDKEVWIAIPPGYTISPYTMVVPV
jgi:hypothetical protein